MISIKTDLPTGGPDARLRIELAGTRAELERARQDCDNLRERLKMQVERAHRLHCEAETLRSKNADLQSQLDTIVQIQAAPKMPPASRGPIEIVLRAVAEYYGLTYKDLLYDGRSPEVIGPRTVAIYLARKMTGQDFSIIAKKMERDSSTIIEAWQKSVAYIRRNSDLHLDSKILKAQIKPLLPKNYPLKPRDSKRLQRILDVEDEDE